ncbi:MAG: WYL domain-containing protein [Pirellulaceae bacterium]
MARNEQLIRQHKILQILERVRYGKTLEELRDDLCEELGISSIHTRTVRRDLEALQAAGLDVQQTDLQRGKVWKLGPRHKQTHKISASATELIALSLGRDLMFPLGGTPFWMGIESFWNKIQEELPDGVLQHYEKYRRTLRVMGVPTKKYDRHFGMIKSLNRAILDHRICSVVYTSLNGQTKEREIEPYTMALFQSSLYVIAAACEDPDPENRIRSFKIDRFDKVEILDKWFDPPPEKEVSQYLDNSLGIFVGIKPSDFKVRIDARAARWVEEDPWHPEQQIKHLKNGDIELSVKAAHELDIIPRVLRLGAHAEIVSPAKARQTMKQIVASMAEKYGVT